MILDTVALVRLIQGRLPGRVMEAFEATETLGVSAVSLFEINQKVRNGRLDVPVMDDGAVAVLTARGIDLMPVTAGLMAKAGVLDWIHEGRTHQDPFDRMIAATALDAGRPVVTSDLAFEGLAAEGLRVMAID